MTDVNVDFLLQDDEPIRADFEVEQDNTLVANISVEGSNDHNVLINRGMDNQHPISAITDLQDTLDTLHGEIGELGQTIGTYGNIVTHNTDEFATAEQGALADTALQPGDNISELVNDSDYATETYVDNGLSAKQDVISDLSTIREGASLGATSVQRVETGNSNGAIRVDGRDVAVKGLESAAYTPSSDYATSAQGALADTALQPNDNISELNNDVGYITSASLPTVNDGTLTIQKNGSSVGTFTANQATNTTVNVVVPTQASDIGALPDTTTISDLVSTAQLNALNSGATTTNIGQITTNENDISDINDKIPSQASSTNQLADKDFVNSSIATNTAKFIGTFANVTDLESYAGTITNNDYAFVINSVIEDNGSDWSSFSDLDNYDKSLLTNFDYGWVINGANFDLYRFDIIDQSWDLRASDISKTSVTLNTAYNRYKATVISNVTTWDYEYTLNNSSFTASQWATINSGATSADVALAQSALQPNDNVSELVNDAGYITGIDTSDVTTALGYTPADDTNVVHKTGTETIGGNKTFSNDVTFSNPATFNSTTNFNNALTKLNNGGYRAIQYKMAGSNTYEDFSYYDNAGTFLGSFRVDNTGMGEFISFTSIQAPTPTADNTTSKQIDTVGARNTKLADYATTASLASYALDSDVVKLTGNQTISGTKSFNASLTRTSTIDPSTTTGETEVRTLSTVTNNGSTVIASYNATRSGTLFSNGQRVANPNINGWYDIRVVVADNGQGYVNTACSSSVTNLCASYVTSSTTSNYLPTMGWVNNASTATNVVHRDSAETITGNKTFSGANTFSGNNSFTGDNTFTKQIYGTLAGYSASNGSTNATPYKKVAECVLTGSYQSVVIPFLYVMTTTGTTSNVYNGRIVFRVDGTAGSAGVNGVSLGINPDFINNGNFAFYSCYKNNYPESNQVTFQIWVYVKNTYQGVTIIPLRQGTGGENYSTSNVTWGNALEARASLPDGYTANSQTFSQNFSKTPSADTTTSTEVDTVGARNTKLGSYVTTNTAQTITAGKTFTGNISISKAEPKIIYKNTALELGVTPTSNLNHTIAVWQDKNGTPLGYIQARYGTDGKWGMGFQVTNGNTWQGVYVGINMSGNAFNTCIAPTDDNTTSTQMDTVGARNTKLGNMFQVVASLPATPDANTFYFIEE